jgi:tubulin-specific chaperone E
MQVGERLVVKDKGGAHLCTVRYIGTVHGKEGRWVGVEWDTAGRGKNDGAFAGKRYFTCLFNAGAGSLIKYEKVKPGISLVDAVSQRYTLGDSDLQDMTIQAGKRTMAVDFTGIGKVSQHLKQLNLITSMTMHEANIARAVCS